MMMKVYAPLASARMLRHSSRPVSPGIIQSLMTTSGRCVWNASQACPPSLTMWHSWPRLRSAVCTISRDVESSSATRIFMTPVSMRGARREPVRARLRWRRTAQASAPDRRSRHRRPGPAQASQLGRSEVGARPAERVSRTSHRDGVAAGDRLSHGDDGDVGLSEEQRDQLRHEVHARRRSQTLQSGDDLRIQHRLRSGGRSLVPRRLRRDRGRTTAAIRRGPSDP